MPYGTVNTDKLQGTLGGIISPDSSVFRNRIINGAMVIDQRNAGASTTPAGSTYTLDRWVYQPTPASKFSIQRSTTAPAGFSNSMLLTVVSAYTPSGNDSINIGQYIEGFNVADLNWGTANAKTVNLSFWVNCSVTGTYSVQFGGDNGRGYIGTYTVSAANTWEYKTITVPGDTSGTYGTTNGTGLTVFFALGAGSGRQNTANTWIASGYTTTAATGSTNLVANSGATWYITGVQLEAGSTASSFEYRSYGQELALCQRYLPVWYGGGDQIITMYNSSTGILGTFKTPVPVRSVVTGLTFSTGANSIFAAYDGFKGGYTPTNAALNNGGINYVTIQCNSTSLGAGQAGLLRVADNQWMYGTGCEL